MSELIAEGGRFAEEAEDLLPGGFHALFAAAEFALELLAFFVAEAEAFAGVVDLAFELFEFLLVAFDLGGEAGEALFDGDGFVFTLVEALFDASDLLGLGGEAAAGAFGFDVAVGEFLALGGEVLF